MNSVKLQRPYSYQLLSGYQPYVRKQKNGTTYCSLANKWLLSPVPKKILLSGAGGRRGCPNTHGTVTQKIVLMYVENWKHIAATT